MLPPAPPTPVEMAPDWHDALIRAGYAVVPGVITRDKAEKYRLAALDWLGSFGNDGLDLSNRSTWTPENLPFISGINTFNHYGVTHERFMWDMRLEPGVIQVFSRIWGTDKLLVSFDALNITLPRRPGHVPRRKWPHVDQSPFREGLQCVQGIICLSQAGPDDGGLTVYPRSHTATGAFFRDHTDRAQWTRKDFYAYTPDEMAWFAGQGFREHKVVAEPGDLIVWDSRLIHFGAEPTAASNTIRTATYVSYTPAAMATPEALATKKAVFASWTATTHWPHDNIWARTERPLRPDGSIDDRRTEPRDKPELTSQLLKLAGVEAY